MDVSKTQKAVFSKYIYDPDHEREPGSDYVRTPRGWTTNRPKTGRNLSTRVYDNEVKSVQRDLVKRGGGAELIKSIPSILTKGVLDALPSVPTIELTDDPSRTRCTYSGRIVLYRDPKSLHGSPMALEHEVSHLADLHTRLKDYRSLPEFSDYTEQRTMLKENADDLTDEEYAIERNELSRLWGEYGKACRRHDKKFYESMEADAGNLMRHRDFLEETDILWERVDEFAESDEMKRISTEIKKTFPDKTDQLRIYGSFTDLIGSVTDGREGTGHDVKPDVEKSEAVSCARTLKKHCPSLLDEYFPNFSRHLDRLDRKYGLA